MKSKQKKYIKKHIGKESVEEIAQKLKLDIEEVKEFVLKFCGNRSNDSIDKEAPKMPSWRKALVALFSSIIFPLVIFLLAFNTNSFHGVLDTLESGQYLSCINGIFQGKVPFRDFIPPVGPLFIWILSGFLFILGKTVYILRAYFLISTIGVYIMLYFLGRQLYRFKVFTYILPIVALVETFNPFWASRWAGYSRFGSGLLGLFLLIKYAKDKNSLYLLLSGVVAGLALLYGIDSGVFLIVCGVLTCILIVIYEPSTHFKENIINIIKRGSVFSLGLAMALIPFAIYMAITKALVPYLEGMYLMMRYHVNAWQIAFPPFFDSLKQYNNLWLFFTSDEFKIYMPRFFYGPVILYIIYMFRNKRNVVDCIVVPLIATYGLLAYRSGCRVVLGPQFDISLLPMLLLLVYFVERGLTFILSKDQSRKKIFPLIVSFLVVAILPTYLIASQKRVYGSWSNWWKYQQQKNELLPVYTHLVRKDTMKLEKLDMERVGPIQISEQKAREIQLVTEYMKGKTSKDEAFFTFPEHSLYNFLADRPAVSRFYIAVYAHTVDKWKKELLSDLQSNPPRYIIYSRSLSYIAKNIENKTELLPEVIEFILKNYSLEKEFMQIGIYRRKQ